MSNEKLQREIENLIREAYDLLPEIIEATRPSDLRAKSQGMRWWDRHRLHVLLDAAEETKHKLTKNIAVTSWLFCLVAELKATLEVIRRWKDDPRWRDIEPSLKDKNHFRHTIGKLRVAEHFMMCGHEVEIVPRGRKASPDLRIRAIGGVQEWLYVECYQPSAFRGKPGKTSESILDKIVSKCMAKAKRQFQKKHPGIIAVFSYNQPGENIERLRIKIANRLDETKRSYLAGILLVNQDILLKRSDEELTFTPILSVEFVSNPSYFGRIDIVSEPREPQPRKIKKLKLPTIKEPKPSMRTIIRSKNANVFPLFKGKGNIDYLCGNCGAVLAEHIWSLSISNIVVLCPSCGSFNEFPKIPALKYPVKGTIAIEKGIYEFSTWINLKQGVTLFGI